MASTHGVRSEIRALAQEGWSPSGTGFWALFRMAEIVQAKKRIFCGVQKKLVTVKTLMYCCGIGVSMKFLFFVVS